MAKTPVSNGQVLGGHMQISADKIAGEVAELDIWQVPIEQVTQVMAALATDSQKYKDVLALVEEVAHRYRIDAVAPQYVRLFERDMRLSRSKKCSIRKGPIRRICPASCDRWGDWFVRELQVCSQYCGNCCAFLGA